MKKSAILLFLLLCISLSFINNLQSQQNNLIQQETKIIGHRGAPAYGGENTLFGFEKAFELGADGFELDLLATKDGKFIVGHDFELSRLIGKDQLLEKYPDLEIDHNKWYVTDFTQGQLKELKVSYPAPGKERPQYKILSDQLCMPTLEQAIECLLENRKSRNRNDFVLYIEIKTKEGFGHTMNHELMKNELKSILQKYELMYDPNIWIQSFDQKLMRTIASDPAFNQLNKSQLAFDNLEEIKPLNSETAIRKYLEKIVIENKLQMVHLWKVPSRYLMEKKKINLIEISHEMGIPIHFYTFRSPRYEKDYDLDQFKGMPQFQSPEEELEYFIQKGADAIMSDYVSDATKILNKLND